MKSWNVLMCDTTQLDPRHLGVWESANLLWGLQWRQWCNSQSYYIFQRLEILITSITKLLMYWLPEAKVQVLGCSWTTFLTVTDILALSWWVTSCLLPGSLIWMDPESERMTYMVGVYMGLQAKYPRHGGDIGRYLWGPRTGMLGLGFTVSTQSLDYYLEQGILFTEDGGILYLPKTSTKMCMGCEFTQISS